MVTIRPEQTLVPTLFDAKNNTIFGRQSTRLAWYSGALLLSVALGASSNAYASVSGGQWYDLTIPGCAAGTPGDSYIGQCSDDNNANVSNQNVVIDTETLEYAGGGTVMANGTASNNQITIKNSTVNKEVYGGFVDENGEASNNKVTIEGGFFDDDIHGGYVGQNGKANNNQVNISDSTVEGWIYGGLIYDYGDANDNQVTIKNSSLDRMVHGGVVWEDGNANNNQVIIENSTGFFHLTGAYVSEDGNANNNQVLISNSELNDVYAADIGGSGSASGNLLRISDGSSVEWAQGAYISDAGLANDNTVELRDSEVFNYIYTAEIADNGIVNNNLLIINSSTIGSEAVAAAVWGSGEANNNRVQISNSSVGQYIAGGMVEEDGQANNNQIHVNNTHVDDEIFGGRVQRDGFANNNTIIIANNSTVGDVVGGFVEGSGQANNNHATIENSHLDGGAAFSGYVDDTGEASRNTLIVSNTQAGADILAGGFVGLNGIATENKVSLYNVQAEIVIGGSVTGGVDPDSHIANNTVLISDNSVVDFAYAGASTAGKVRANTVQISNSRVENAAGGYSIVGNVSENTVHISDNSQITKATGGHSEDGSVSENTVYIGDNSQVIGAVFGGKTTHGNAINNRVIISGAPNLSQAWLYGGATLATSQGNTLELHSKGVEAQNLAFFQNYEFVLPSNTKNGDTLLTLFDANGTDLGDATVAISSQGNSKLADGDQVRLVHNAAGVDSSGITQHKGQISNGAFLEHSYQLGSNADTLYASITNTGLSAQTKAPLEGRLGGMGLLDQSAIRSGDAFNQAVAVTQNAGTGAFGGISGGSSRYKTGSHVDVNGVNVLLGIAKGFESASGQTTAGAFFEGGYGRHKTHNSFSGVGSVDGRGKSRYFGVGLLARHDWAKASEAGAYAEASLRGGRLHSDWRSSDLKNTQKSAKYDTSSTYFGLHAGVGYRLPISTKTELDLAAKYYWTRVGSDTVTIDGSDFHMKSLNSSISRLAATLNHNFTERSTGYIGLAWEHEFDGKARATVHGMSAPAPSLKGNTGIIEAGLSFQPSAKSPFSARLGLRGYTGKRRGADGYLNASYKF